MKQLEDKNDSIDEEKSNVKIDENALKKENIIYKFEKNDNYGDKNQTLKFKKTYQPIKDEKTLIKIIEDTDNNDNYYIDGIDDGNYKNF